VSVLNRRLARTLLSPSPGQKRLQALQRARSRIAEEGAENLRWIERDLHDGTEAELVAFAITLSLADDANAAQDGRLTELIARARTQTDDCIAGLRRITGGINPIASGEGLAEAIQALTERCSVPVRLGLVLPERASPAIERVVYFCVAELLTNITKHAGASEASVELVIARGAVLLTVADDGRGGASPGKDGSGLAGLAARLDTVDGTLTVDSPPGNGTRITIELPATV
jgi:signal transduction histidine kinase